MTSRILLLLGFIMSLSFTQAQNSTDCKSPNELFASVRDTIASLNWKSAVANSASVVQYKLRNDSIWKTENLTTNTLLLKGLKPCSEYQFRVKSVCSITASSDYSEIKVFKTNGCVAPCFSPREVKGVTGDSKASFSWASTGSFAYEIQYQDASNNGAWITEKVTIPVFSANNLRACTKYNFRVRSICSGATSSALVYSDWSSTITVATTGCTITRCETPRIKVEVLATGVTVKWDSARGVTYDLQIKNLRDSSWRTISNISGNSYKFLTGLANCSVYELRIKANCPGTVNGAWGYSTRFSTLGCQPVCLVPQGVKVTVSDTVAVVSWVAPQTTKFTLQYKLEVDSTWKSVNVTGTNLFVLKGLARCKKYLVRVQAACGTTLLSDFSGVVNFATGGCNVECITPRQLIARTIDSTNSAYLSWSSTGARAYVIEFKNLSDSSQNYRTDTVTTTFLLVKNLARCTKYTFRVRAICSDRMTTPSEIFTFATGGCPEPCVLPRELKADVINDTLINLYWAGVVGKYELQYRLSTETDNQWKSLSVQTPAHKLSLLPCKIYIWRVRKVCDNGTSDWSEIMKFETRGCSVPCVLPLDLKSEIVNDTIAYMYWTGLAGKYEIQYRQAVDTLGEWKSVSVQAAAHKLALLPCKAYVWRVRKICDNATSDWSPIARFETRGCQVPCALPLDLKSEIVNDTIAYMYWTGLAGKYEIQYRQAVDTLGEWKSVSVQAAAHKLALLPCKAYVWRVRKICDNAASDWSPIARFETRGCQTPCVVPINLTNQVLDSIAYFAWAGVVGKYELQYRLAADTAWKSVNTQGTEFKLVLSPCKIYAWRVRKICEGAVSDWSEIMRFETRGCQVPCALPTNLRTELVGDTTINFFWGGLTGKYELQYRPATTTASSDTTWKSVNTDNPLFKTNLQRCNIYVWRVRKVCDANNVSPWVDGLKFETKGCVIAICERPTNLLADITLDTVAVFSWTGTVVQYDVQYRLVGSGDNGWILSTVTGAGTKIRSLKRCADYEWRVRRYCTGAMSDWSVISKFSTKGCPIAVCPAPVNVTVTQTVDLVYVTWATDMTNDTVIVKYALSTDTVYKELIGATPNGVVLRGLQACKIYKLRVFRKCANGTFSAPVEKEFKTSGANCLTDEGGSVYNLKMSNVVKNVAVSPNPGNDYIQVQYDLTESSDVKIQLVSLQGQIIKQLDGGNQDSGNYTQYLDNLSDVNQGMYFVIIRSNGKVMTTQKWMKQ